MPQQVIEHMQLKPTDVVADVGAGTGYCALRLSRVVPQGIIYAVDIQPAMLAILAQRKKQFKADNVMTVQGTETDPRLPAQAVDVVLLVDAGRTLQCGEGWHSNENAVRLWIPSPRVPKETEARCDAFMPAYATMIARCNVF